MELAPGVGRTLELAIDEKQRRVPVGSPDAVETLKIHFRPFFPGDGVEAAANASYALNKNGEPVLQMGTYNRERCCYWVESLEGFTFNGAPVSTLTHEIYARGLRGWMIAAILAEIVSIEREQKALEGESGGRRDGSSGQEESPVSGAPLAAPKSRKERAAHPVASTATRRH